jgi:hypothetical protein
MVAGCEAQLPQVGHDLQAHRLALRRGQPGGEGVDPAGQLAGARPASLGQVRAEYGPDLISPGAIKGAAPAV